MEQKEFHNEIKSEFDEIVEKHLNKVKRFRERRASSQDEMSGGIFQFADNDFYFYSSAVKYFETSSNALLKEMLKIALRSRNYHISKIVKKRNEKNNPHIFIEPHIFIIEKDGKKCGFRFSDYSEEEYELAEQHQIDMNYIICTYKPEKSEKGIARDNKFYQEQGLNIKKITVKEFFDEYFDAQTYGEFLSAVEQYNCGVRDIMGLRSIKVLSAMNLSMQKKFAETQLKDWSYEKCRYHIIDEANEKIKKYLYIKDYAFDSKLQEKIESNYFSHQLYRSLCGTEEYAKSFISSEWLYHSLKGTKGFDYTSVVSGYLKSIEQLLLKIVELNLDNNCVIAIKEDCKKDAKEKGVVFYTVNNQTGEKTIVEDDKRCKYLYIDYTEPQKAYADSSIGTFEYFLRNNHHVFLDPSLAKVVSDMVSCFRVECRNGYFHTHNLENWDIVEKTRENAILLYYILLGSCSMAAKKVGDLGIEKEDSFDELCKKIREFSHKGFDFIFEFESGEKRRYWYDIEKNTLEYSEDGVEHYEELLFYEIESFDSAAHNELFRKLGLGEAFDCEFHLTRETRPVRIWGCDHQNQLHEIIE